MAVFKIDFPLTNIFRCNNGNTFANVFHWASKPISNPARHLKKAMYILRFRMNYGIAEHVEEGRSKQGVELGERFAAFGSQSIGRIENCRNPLLLFDRWEGNFECF